MKVTLEPQGSELRGICLTSETDEEKEVLWNIWAKGHPVVLSGAPDGRNIELTIAPTIGGEDGWPN